MKKVILLILILVLQVYSQVVVKSPQYFERLDNQTIRLKAGMNNLWFGNGGFRWLNNQLQFSNDLTNWYAIPQSLTQGGGWTLGFNKIYQSTAGTPVHIRTNAGDTTGSGLLNVYGHLSVVPSSSASNVLTTKSLQSTAPLGSELVTNGTFDSNTGWTWGTGWVYDATNQEADHTTFNTAPLTQTINVVSGTTYQISFQIKNMTTGSVTIDIGGVFVTNYGSYISFDYNSTFNRTLVANSTGSVLLSITPTSNFDGSIDNVSIKAITGTSQPNLSFIDETDNVFADLRGNKSLSNIALGLGDLSSNTTGYYNSAFGHYTLYSNTIGYNNSAFGRDVLYNNTTGFDNSAFGLGVLHFNTSGYKNSAFGVDALHFNTTGYSNSAFGRDALFFNTTGYYNSALGSNAGASITTGYNNVFVGYDAGYNGSQKVDAQNSIAIGANTYTTNNNQVVIGSGTTTHGLGKIPDLTGNGLDINGTTIRLQFRTISSPTATGNVGEMCYDANYIYICIATNTWKRIPIPSSW
jgi:hypothetical protein